MQAANRLQKALKNGRASFGGWQMLPGANLSRVIARTPNLDWICIDCEHGNISDDAMHESVAAIAACGVSPVVRVADGQHWMIKRALDAGAHGIIVPLLQSAQDAKNVVRFSKFPPQGTNDFLAAASFFSPDRLIGNRGLGSPFSMEKFSEHGANANELSLMEYYRQANDSIVVIVQIETASALEQIKEIAAVDGVDVCFIGPVDLGNSIGHPVESFNEFPPQLEEAVNTVHSATQDAGKYTAIYTAGGESAKTYADQGFNMINTMNDVAAIKMMFGQAVNTARS